MIDIEKFNEISASSYYKVVSLATTSSEEAVYYLLQRRLRRALQRMYTLHGYGLSDDYDDTIDDFFLYLYEGNGQGTPFSIFGSIQNKEAFFGWVVATYRHFLLDRAKAETERKTLLKEVRVMSTGDGKGLSSDTMIRYVATAIAYADQRFKPFNLFILYRSLLTLLDRSRTIPQDEMAETMQLHPVTYRVRSKRQRDIFRNYILLLEAGQHLELDRHHELMRLCIEDEFYRLYDLLMDYYNKVLDRLPAKNAIRALRLHYYREKGLMMHEKAGYGYRFNMKISEFYNALKS